VCMPIACVMFRCAAQGLRLAFGCEGVIGFSGQQRPAEDQLGRQALACACLSNVPK
jgi:hypothetical protein